MFTRRRAAEPVLSDDGTAACLLCGAAVEIAADGRCRLGHQVVSEETVARRLAEVAAQADDVSGLAPPAPHAAVTGSVVTEPAVSAAALVPPAEALSPPPPPPALAAPDAPAPAPVAEDDSEHAMAAALARLQDPAPDTVPLLPVEAPAPRPAPQPRVTTPADEAEPIEDVDARTRLLEAASWLSDSGS